MNCYFIGLQHIITAQIDATKITMLIKIVKYNKYVRKQRTEADLRYVQHLCRRAKIALSLVFLSFSEDDYFFALLRSCLA